MRRKDRQAADIEEILAIIGRCKVCRLALQDQNGLYIVPMNFGYAYDRSVLTLYFHSAREGRKISAIAQNSRVAFEMDCAHRLLESDRPCGTGFSYQSVTGQGRAVLLEDPEKRRRALSLLMKHQTGKDYAFDDAEMESVAMIEVTADSFTGKRHT